MLVPVILAGGSGTRLWPMSRKSQPKQFLPMVSERSMFQETAARAAALADASAPIVICSELHRFMVAEQLEELGIEPRAIVLEPEGRNTAPAIAVAALLADRELGSGRAVLLVLAADHVIQDAAAFASAVAIARQAADLGKLATFGIVPQRPETGYGYVRRGADHGGYFDVERFVEKPDFERAQAYLDEGSYYWNSGMFMFAAESYLGELARLAPDIDTACRAAVARAEEDRGFLRLDREAFLACRTESIDYAVMERTSSAVVVPMDAGWSDVGSWAALYEVLDRDADGNVVQGDAVLEDCRRSYVVSHGRLVTAIGLDSHVIVDTDDALLVAPVERSQDVKHLVDVLSRQGRAQVSTHRREICSWGSVDTLARGERFRVSRLLVKPGAACGWRVHERCAQHWVVISGVAKITRGDELLMLRESESICVSAGVGFSIENAAAEELELIETQSGDGLGEDDVVQLGDRGGRSR